jgi:hypothetical protein
MWNWAGETVKNHEESQSEGREGREWLFSKYYERRHACIFVLIACLSHTFFLASFSASLSYTI